MILEGRIENIGRPKKDVLAFMTDKDKEFFIFNLSFKNKEQHYTQIIKCVGKSFKLYQGEEVQLEGEFGKDKLGEMCFNFRTAKMNFKKSLKNSSFVKNILGNYNSKLKSKIAKEEGLKVSEVRDFESKVVEAFTKEDVDFFVKRNIPERVAQEFIKEFKHQKSYDILYVKLEKYGFSDYDVKNIISNNEEIEPQKIIDNIEKNPYKLMSTLKSVTFRKCDFIYAKAGGKSDSTQRMVASIFEALRYAYDFDYNCYLKKNELIEKTFEILDTTYFKENIVPDREKVDKMIDTLIAKGQIVLQKDRIYLKKNYDEQERLKDFCKLAVSAPKENKNVFAFIKKYEAEHNITLGREQKESIVTSCNSLISIITGGAGVGKTSSLACIISYLLEVEGLKEDEIALCAPTGKASQRMQESIFKQVGRKLTATTIHVLLKVDAKDETLETFTYNLDNKLNKKVVVVDETSMLNYRIADALISAIKRGTKVIFLGDIEQLEPVGAGFFFRDAIESGVPTTYLKEVHRQKGASTIIPLSQAIRDENLFADNIEKKSDFSFINVPVTMSFDDKISMIAKIFLAGVKKSSLDDTMIITPLRETVGNTKIDSKTLSIYIQDILLPDKDGEEVIVKNGFKFKVGSKVIMTKNDNKLGLINGQIGYIEEIDIESSLVKVDFEGELFELGAKELEALRLAYAITVHKSQGSEWKNVIYCCFNDTTMNKKNLVYTAVTRAKQNLVVVGNKATFLKSDKLKAIRHNSVLLNEKEAN